MKFSFILCDPVPQLGELAARMDRLAQLGYQGVELVATHPLDYAVDELAAVAEQTGVPVVSLLSGWSYSNEGLCLSSADVAIRDRAVDRLIEYVALAQRLGALVVVGLMQGLSSDEPDAAIANTRIAEALARVARAAEATQVPLIIEPVNHLQVGFNHTAAEVSALLERVGSPAAGLMLDTIHMNIEERSMLNTIRHYGRRIGHFRLCESGGGVFGSGNLDFAAILAALDEVRYDKYVSIKIYRGANWEDAARTAIEFLRRLRA